MGVPRLFPWICRNFPNSIKYFLGKESEIEKMDHFFIDGNGILHAIKNEVMADLRYLNASYEEKEKMILKRFFDKIVYLCEMVNPTKTVYIAIDGPAPLCKQTQQRQRRFTAIQTTSFNSNSISPGTTFMLHLTKYLNYRIRCELSGNPKWRNIQVIFSPPTVAGEGEHKCLEFIRNLDTKMEDKVCIFSPDGDLIMLTLALHIPKIYIFKEDPYQFDFYHMINMGEVRKRLPLLLGRAIQRDRTNDDVSNDFILLGCFVGNDFIPRIQMFLYLEDGLELMLHKYITTITHHRHDTLTKHGQFNLNGFRHFVKYISEYEEKYLIDSLYKEIESEELINHTLRKHIHNGSLDFSGYRKDYYLKAGIDKEEGIKIICRDYLKAIIFVYNYYIFGLPDWNYYYPWHYPPLMTDFSSYLETLNDVVELSKYPKTYPCLPFVQLLSVLPPSSAYLLPPEVRWLMTEEDSELVRLGYYPSEFEIDYEGKRMLHEAVIKLPFVDRHVIQREYEKCKLKMEYPRNESGKDMIFRNDLSKEVVYKGMYGTIKSRVNVKYKQEVIYNDFREGGFVAAQIVKKNQIVYNIF
jgi:5'-3' exonuclease